MAWQDTVNAGLEWCWIITMVLSARRLWRDRNLRGVHPSHLALVAASVVWFMYYYWHLRQFVSFAAAVVYCPVALTYIGMAIYFWRQDVLTRVARARREMYAATEQRQRRREPFGLRCVHGRLLQTDCEACVKMYQEG